MNEQTLAEWAGGGAIHDDHLNATVPAGLKAWARRAAAERECSLSQVVRVALVEFLRVEHPRLIEKEG